MENMRENNYLDFIIFIFSGPAEYSTVRIYTPCVHCEASLIVISFVPE